MEMRGTSPSLPASALLPLSFANFHNTDTKAGRREQRMLGQLHLIDRTLTKVVFQEIEDEVLGVPPHL